MSELREKIFATDDLPRENVAVEEWGGLKLEIRGMTGLERARFMQVFTDDSGAVNWEMMYPAMVAQSTYDPDTGEKVFEETDYEGLNAKSGLALERIAGVAMRLSGMDRKAEDRLGKASSTEKDDSISS